jgi:hypothetical protein
MAEEGKKAAAPRKKARAAPKDTRVSLYPLTLEEAVDKLLKSGPNSPSGGRSAPADRKRE